MIGAPASIPAELPAFTTTLCPDSRARRSAPADDRVMTTEIAAIPSTTVSPESAPITATTAGVVQSPMPTQDNPMQAHAIEAKGTGPHAVPGHAGRQVDPRPAALLADHRQAEREGEPGDAACASHDPPVADLATTSEACADRRRRRTVRSALSTHTAREQTGCGHSHRFDPEQSVGVAGRHGQRPNDRADHHPDPAQTVLPSEQYDGPALTPPVSGVCQQSRPARVGERVAAAEQEPADHQQLRREQPQHRGGRHERQCCRRNRRNHSQPWTRVDPLPSLARPPGRQQHWYAGRATNQPGRGDRARLSQDHQRQRDLGDPEREVRHSPPASASDRALMPLILSVFRPLRYPPSVW